MGQEWARDGDAPRCRYWAPATDHDRPEKDHVPSGNLDTIYLEQLWPVTLDSAWCGEDEVF